MLLFHLSWKQQLFALLMSDVRNSICQTQTFGWSAIVLRSYWIFHPIKWLSSLIHDWLKTCEFLKLQRSPSHFRSELNKGKKCVTFPTLTIITSQPWGRTLSARVNHKHLNIMGFTEVKFICFEVFQMFNGWFYAFISYTHFFGTWKTRSIG